uniref:Uncharacterized protein n=1 Tax=Flavobacterium columnare TaxID=996 RepID=A0AA94JP48_9FLAO
MVFKGIVGVFMWLYNKAIGVFTAVKDFVVDAFKWIVKKISNAINAIGSFFSSIWEWFKTTFSGFVKFIDEWLIQPIKSAFNEVWDWIVQLLEKIMAKLKKVFDPIKSFQYTLFIRRDERHKCGI